jgi:hypothetical protein
MPADRRGGRAGEIVATGATVEGFDHSSGRLTLRAATGEWLELKVPKVRLAGLQAGDRVQVTIQKVPGPPGRSPPGRVEPPPLEQTRSSAHPRRPLPDRRAAGGITRACRVTTRRQTHPRPDADDDRTA